jgi:hypothetical protein
MTYYVLQYNTGDYVYVDIDSIDVCKYPCELHQATIFKTIESAKHFCTKGMQIVKIEMSIVKDNIEWEKRIKEYEIQKARNTLKQYGINDIG